MLDSVRKVCSRAKECLAHTHTHTHTHTLNLGKNFFLILFSFPFFFPFARQMKCLRLARLTVGSRTSRMLSLRAITRPGWMQSQTSTCCRRFATTDSVAQTSVAADYRSRVWTGTHRRFRILCSPTVPKLAYQPELKARDYDWTMSGVNGDTKIVRFGYGDARRARITKEQIERAVSNDMPILITIVAPAHVPGHIRQITMPSVQYITLMTGDSQGPWIMSYRSGYWFDTVSHGQAPVKFESLHDDRKFRFLIWSPALLVIMAAMFHDI
jgi:hypothetical protein